VRPDSKRKTSAGAPMRKHSDSSRISRVFTWLHAQYPSWEGGDQLGPIRVAVLNGRRPGRATLIVFRGGQRTPSIVVKLVTRLEDAGHISREARSLELANSQLVGLLDPPPPRLLGSTHQPGLAALAITAVPGRRSKLPDLAKAKPSRSDVHAVRRHIDSVRSWTRSLREVEMPEQPMRDGQQLADRVHRFIELGGLPAAVVPRIQHLAIAMEQMPVKWSPHWQHGDVAPGNVLWHKGRIRLVDWEAASPAHDPWRDDAYLLLSLGRATQHETGVSSVGSAIRAAFGSQSWAGRVAESSYRESWPHPIPVGWALISTTIEHALEREEYGATTPFWRDLAVDLLFDQDLRDSCGWLVPHW
jgi:hypothetical protein